jgi:hypothetical protein
VDLEELCGVGGGEHGREVRRRVGIGRSHARILPVTAPLKRDS